VSQITLYNILGSIYHVRILLTDRQLPRNEDTQKKILGCTFVRKNQLEAVAITDKYSGTRTIQRMKRRTLTA